MKSLSLRTRLLLWSSATTAVTLALVVVLVDVTFRAYIRDQLEQRLTFARQVAEDARVTQMGTRIGEAAMIAVDARLRAALETGDRATIEQTLAEVYPLAARGWAALLTPDGGLIAATPMAPVSALSTADDLVSEALYYDTGDLWLSGDELTEVAASALLFGAAPVAVLVAGNPVGEGQVSALEAVVGGPVALLAAGQPILGTMASQLPEEGLPTLTTLGFGLGDAVELVSLGGERFLAATAALVSNADERVGTMVLLDSYDAALQPSNRLRAALIGIFLLGLVLIFGVSSVFSRAITVPVGRLLDETERLGRGDLDEPIVPVRADEIGRLAQSFEDMRVSLREAHAELIRAERLSAIGKAASAVVHDLTQPLSTIAGAIGLLRMDASPETRERCFGAIDGELERLQRMKQEIVEFARGESKLDEGEVRIDSFLENTVSALRQQLARQDITLSVGHGYTGEWYIDSYRLGRVIENLVRNAAAAIGRGGKITVRSTTTEGTLVLDVEDDGPGIPRERLEEVFEPFVSYGKKEGTGLGLAIARNVVQQHGGSITVASSPEGTTFTMMLPRRAAAAQPGAAPAELVGT